MFTLFPHEKSEVSDDINCLLKSRMIAGFIDLLMEHIEEE